MWFIGEWWNDASSDNVSYIFGLISHWKIINFNQIIALLLMAWGAWRLAHIIPSPLSEWIIDIGDKVSDTLGDTYDAFEKLGQRYFKKGKKLFISFQKKIKK
ncbi:MAG: hypothetical protein WCK88_03170 [bacterium]